jgi:hypothetical protein
MFQAIPDSIGDHVDLQRLTHTGGSVQSNDCFDAQLYLLTFIQ